MIVPQDPEEYIERPDFLDEKWVPHILWVHEDQIPEEDLMLVEVYSPDGEWLNSDVYSRDMKVVEKC